MIHNSNLLTLGLMKFKILDFTKSKKGYMMKKTIISAILATALMTSVNATGLIAGATEPTQIMNNMQLMAQYSKQLQQYSTQVNQYTTQLNQLSNQMQSYKAMLANIGTLPDRQWNNFTNQVQQLKDITNNTAGMTYIASSYEESFRNLHPGYEEMIKSGKVIDPLKSYQQLSKQNLGSVDAALKQLNMSSKDIESDIDVMKELQQVSQSAEGQKAAIQAASEIALHQTNTLKKLQQTMMLSAQLQSQTIASEQTNKDIHAAKMKKFDEDRVKNTKEYKPNYTNKSINDIGY